MTAQEVIDEESDFYYSCLKQELKEKQSRYLDLLTGDSARNLNFNKQRSDLHFDIKKIRAKLSK